MDEHSASPSDETALPVVPDESDTPVTEDPTETPFQHSTPVVPVPPASSPASGVSLGGAITIALVAALIVGTLAGGLAGYAGQWLASRGGITSTPETIRVIPSDTEEPIAAAAAAALPAVVNIDISGDAVAQEDGELPQGHPGVPVMGNGSGVAWTHTDNGGTYIITNAHVVADATKITVTGTDREHHAGTVIGVDTETDIAVVEIDAELSLIEVGDSDDLLVGQSSVAIGSPFGLEHSVSAGVISALGRALTTPLNGEEGVYPLVDVIQTDAAINPGNSGGALVDRYGALIGINAAIYSDTGSSGGIGFAIPVNTAVRIANDLVENGRAEHPFLGILGRDVDPVLVEEENLPVQEGAYIVDITPGTNAEKADLLPGDVIVMLNDDPILSMEDLILQVRRHEIGDIVTIALYRNGERMEVEMEVGVKPDNLDLAPSQESSPSETP